MSDFKRLQSKFLVVSPDTIFSPGQLLIRQGRILEVTSNCDSRPDVDFGDQVILPGLINCHTHLEFSDLSAPFPAGSSFPDWIRSVLGHRRRQESELSQLDLEERRRIAIQQGLREAARTGTVYLADIVTPPWTPSAIEPDVEQTSNLDNSPELLPGVLALPEIIGLTEDRFQETLDWALAVYEQASDPNHYSHQAGISPHAPYSLLWEELLHVFAKIDDPPVTAVHLAESLDELEWLEAARGAFADSFKKLAIPFPSTRPTIDEILEFLKQRRRSLLVHGNYLTKKQISRLSNSAHLSVVYCPRTHQHFDHAAYPLATFLQAGVRVVLGTDSRASNPDLNLWSEVVAARKAHPEWSPRQALAAVTSQAADALGVEADYGTLKSGRRARLNVVPADAGWTIDNLLDAMTSQNLALQLYSVD